MSQNENSLVLRIKRDFSRWQHGDYRLKQFKQTFFSIDRQALAPYAGLLIITCFVLLGNQANSHANAASDLDAYSVTDVEPETVESVLDALDPLTPEIYEDATGTAALLVFEDEFVINRPALTEMDEAEKLSKKDPIPYVVQKGDSLVSIARANNRTVATILEANGIAPADASKLKPGMVLLIPQEDTSDSMAWLEIEQRERAEVAKKRAAEQAKLRSQQKQLASSRERSASGYDGASDGDFIVPIRHNGITRGLVRGHTGIDYRADTGTPVVSAANGRVIEVTHGWAGGWGISILLDNGNGRTSRYAHLSDTAVGIGQIINQGQLIGYSGNTGRSTGSHLHFEVRRNGRAVNPF